MDWCSFSPPQAVDLRRRLKACDKVAKAEVRDARAVVRDVKVVAKAALRARAKVAAAGRQRPRV